MEIEIPPVDRGGICGRVNFHVAKMELEHPGIGPIRRFDWHSNGYKIDPLEMLTGVK